MKSDQIDQGRRPHCRLSANQVVLVVLQHLLPARRQALWFSELFALVTPFGIRERCLRTSLSRLAQLRLVQSSSIGRCTNYRLAARPAETAVPATASSWDGDWCIAIRIGGKTSHPQRAACAAELFAAGFRMLGTDTFVRPQFMPGAVREILVRHGMQDHMLVFTSAQPWHPEAVNLATLVDEYWRVQWFAAQYRAFTQRCTDLIARIERDADSGAAYTAGARLLHEWRLLSATDPCLPKELLPRSWQKTEAAIQLERLRHQLVNGEFVRTALEGARNTRLPGAIQYAG
ncbi:MAG: PaaX family transcriptional regulator C-terminal domain-containing protein [Telluria sp.]